MDIGKYLNDHIELVHKIGQDHQKAIFHVAETIVAAIQSGGKLLVIGNGGSAADAQHFAGELVGRFRKERKAIPAIALATDNVILTAVGNDYGFETIFSRQVEALATSGDIVMGISTSGRSGNVLKALKTAKSLGCTTLALLGCDGGPIATAVDRALVVPSFETPHIQEAHITIIHILCSIIESRLACEGQGLP